MIWQGYYLKEHQEISEWSEVKNKPFKAKKNPAKLSLNQGENFKPLQSALSQSFEQDELNDMNPFTHLSSLEPLHQIMVKGVSRFRRATLRSPDYQDEGGYDLLSYEVEHNDGAKSSILAYLEKPDPTMWRNVGAPDQRIPFVIFMVSEGDHARYFFFRNGDLIEQSEMSASDAQALIARRMSLGIPLLSVAR